jgi:hypothetical protein
MNGHLGNLIAATATAYRLALRRIAPTRAVGQGAATGRDSSAAPEGAGAWDRPLSEIIARRAIRVCNRDPKLIAAYEHKQTILSRGRA